MKYFYTLLFFVIILSGCGKKQTIKYNQPELPGTVYYEKAWVEPKIILTDSIFTLIKAARLDSFLVEKPMRYQSSIDNSLQFNIVEDSCFTIVNMQNPDGIVIKSFIARFLKSGFYKVTLDLSRLSDQYKFPYYFLKVEYCSFENYRKIP
ncbi:MAG: hypothetical protein U9N54_02270 [candidate division Zixibacteria bacterium]|nr:hypothetical protein [candidate division Zixibacteria bacterium]